MTILASRWRSGTTLYRASGREVTLGDYIDKGNQGAIFAIAESDLWVAKLYQEVQHDLDAFVRLCDARRLFAPQVDGLIVVAPQGTLSERVGGPPVGCIIRKVPRDEFDPLDLVSKVLLPFAPLDHRIETARVLANGIAWIHEQNFIVGDLKPGNILRHENGLPLAIIDVDSFCALSPAGEYLFTRRAFTELHRAPEVTARSLPSFNTDHFALAVIILEILFGGVHPYGRERRDRDDDVQGRIASGDCWLFDPPAYHVEAGHPGIEVLPTDLQVLARSSLGPGDRPPADEWARALGGARADACPGNPGHERFAGGACSTCAVEVPSRRAVRVPPRVRAQPVPAASTGAEWQWALVVVLLVAVLVVIAMVAR